MRKRINLLRDRLAFAAALALVLALPGLAQYREYNISGIVVDSQKNPLAGVQDQPGTMARAVATP
jgi:hypothetical protein